MFVKYNDLSIRGIMNVVDPGNRKDVKIHPFNGPKDCNSYWDGGSRTYYTFVDLLTYKTVSAPENHPWYNGKDFVCKELPLNVCLVETGYFCGRPMTPRIHFNEQNLIKLLPQKIELSEDERKVLDIVRSFKSTYRADEFRRCGFGLYSPSNVHIASLVEKGLLSVTGRGISITTEGKNV